MNKTEIKRLLHPKGGAYNYIEVHERGSHYWWTNSYVAARVDRSVLADLLPSPKQGRYRLTTELEYGAAEPTMPLEKIITMLKETALVPLRRGLYNERPTLVESKAGILMPWETPGQDVIYIPKPTFDGLTYPLENWEVLGSTATAPVAIVENDRVVAIIQPFERIDLE